MNWLAHVFLSEDNIEFRLGNLLADLVKGKDRQGMSPDFLRGTRCHQAIDVFTDFHPIVERSKLRIGAEYGRFAGILVDVFYDHLLASDWDRYSHEPLEAFTARLYEAIRANPLPLTGEARRSLDRMMADDRLGSYRHPEGIQASLQRISTRLTERLGRTFSLGKAVTELTEKREGFAQDFGVFFPELQEHVTRWICGSQNEVPSSIGTKMA